MKVVLYKIQPAPRPDHMTSDGTVLHQWPYPLFVDETSEVHQSHSFNAVVGFVRDLAHQVIDFRLADVINGDENVIGAYVVVQDHDGGWATLITAVETFEKVRYIEK